MFNNKKKKIRIPEDPEKAYAAALKTAMNIVAYKDNTLSQLREKLSDRGYSSETVDGVCSYMVGKGFINDGRMIYRFARNLAVNKLYGKKRIMAEISRKNFSSDAVENFSFDNEELEEVDFSVICLRLLKKRGGEKDDKTFAALMRYGHSVSDIKRAYAMLEKCEDDV